MIWGNIPGNSTQDPVPGNLKPSLEDPVSSATSIFGFGFVRFRNIGLAGWARGSMRTEFPESPSNYRALNPKP